MLNSNEDIEKDKNSSNKNPPNEGESFYKGDGSSKFKTNSQQSLNTPQKNPFHLHNFNDDLPPEMLQRLVLCIIKIEKHSQITI